MQDSSKVALDEARAAFQVRLDEMEVRIRRRVRCASDRHLSAFHLDDWMASGRRRLDKAFLEGRITVTSAEEIEAYFYQAVHHRFLDEVRREMSRRAAEAAAARAAASRLDLIKENAADTLARLKARLRSDERQAINLRARGLPHKQIADELGLPLSTHRARWRRLCARIQDSPGEP